jgi:hypothetical protein
LGLKQNVAVDRETNSVIRLNAAIAFRARDRSIVHVRTRDNAAIWANAEGEIGKRRAAGENISSFAVGIFSSRNLGVVCGNHGVWEKKERGASISNGINAERLEAARADCVPATGELPEAVFGIDGSVANAASVFGRVNESKVIGTRGALLEIRCENRRSEGALYVCEKSVLLRGANSVDGAERKAEETGASWVLRELRTDCLSRLNRLLGVRDSTNGDNVIIDITAGRAAISIGDWPRLAWQQFGGAAWARLVQRLAFDVWAGSLRRKDPAITN